MSLINEALKKARVEAARQHAIERGLPHSPLPQHMPRARKTRSMSWFLAAAVLVLAVTILLMVMRRPEEPLPLGANLVTVEAPPPLPSASADEPADVPVELPVEVSTPAAASPSIDAAVQPIENVEPAPQPPPAEAQPRATSESIASVPVSLIEPVPTPAPPADDDPVVSNTQTSRGAELSFVAEARLADGTQLTLDFIVWSQSKPFAQINGRFVEPGAVIHGYTIEEIDPEAVRLRGAAGVVVLKSQ